MYHTKIYHDKATLHKHEDNRAWFGVEKRPGYDPLYWIRYYWDTKCWKREGVSSISTVNRLLRQWDSDRKWRENPETYKPDPAYSSNKAVNTFLANTIALFGNPDTLTNKYSMYGESVRLTADLTRYHPKLKVGAEGVTTEPHGMWARSQDRFVSVQFGDGIGNWDILWESLERINRIERTAQP